jgi:hypothetical protein
MHASGSPQNSDGGGGGSSSDNSDESDNDSSMDSNDDKSDTWSMEKSNNAMDSGSMDNNDAMDSGSMDNNDAMDSGSMDNNDAMDSGSMEKSNDALSPPSTGGPTGINNALRVESNSTNSTKIPAYCKSCNDDIYNGTGDFASMILAGHNRERALLGVAPLVWNNELASRAQDLVNYNLTHGLLTHCPFVQGNEQIEPCKYLDGENGAQRYHCEQLFANGTCSLVTKTPAAQMQEGWFSENPTSHWLQTV